MSKLRQRILPFKQAIPSILLYQLISAAITGLWMGIFSTLSKLLLTSVGKFAVSSGDFLFLFTSWQGILIVVLALITLYVFIAVDVCALVILCGRLLRGEKPSVFTCFLEAFPKLRLLVSPVGFLMVLYIALLSPLVGIGFNITLTEKVYIPKFITSVIYSNPLYTAGMVVVYLLLLFVGFLFIFIVHGMMFDGMKSAESAKNSLRLVKKNVKTLLKELIIFGLLFVAVTALVLLIGVIVFAISIFVPMSESLGEVLETASVTYVSVVTAVMGSFSMSFLALKIALLYFRFTSDGEWEYQQREKKASPLVILSVIAIVLIIALMTVIFTFAGDDLLPSEIKCEYIAHRAGGVEAPENTVAGIEKAYELGAIGSEIDIQRTSDGYYVVNHDADFKRTAGVSKKPSEMTLDEVRQLRVDGEPVPTLEEMLDASHDKVILFVELKGDTADQQMAEDAVRIIKEKNMVDETVLISLKYDLIDYIETKYPEVYTGYLAFASFGDTAALNCDFLALEEESATDSMIESIHEAGKLALVWTVNDDSDIEDFMESDADAIITDSVKRSKEIREELEKQ